MTTLDELEKLADAARPMRNFNRFNFATLEEVPIIEPPSVRVSSETLKQLIALVRLQHSAVKATMSMMDEGSYKRTMRGEKGFDTLRVIEAYEQFGGE
jgi:hypothetical protein